MSVSMSTLIATPTSVFWTNCTTDVYEPGEVHIDEDNYFTIFNRRGHGTAFPPDTGVEFGLFSVGDFNVEAGIDYFGGTTDPLFFNAGIGAAEDMFFTSAPSIKLAIFGAGTRYHGRDKTNYNIVDLILGKTIPGAIGGRFFLGGFRGSRTMGKDQQGVMVGYQRLFCPEKYQGKTEYHKWIFSADYASGKNIIGGGGFAVGYYFTPDISLLTGPVWFNSKKLNGNWKWSVQIDIGFSLF